MVERLSGPTIRCAASISKVPTKEFEVNARYTGATTLGRPRSFEADSRILHAALELYGQAGWHGFNLSKVACLAEVGKSSMYARWTEREDLLLDAFHTLVPVQLPDGASPREILVNEVCYRAHLYLGEFASALRRVFVEVGAGDQPIITAVHEHLYVTPITKIRTLLWDHKKAGTVSKDTSITRLLDAVEGSVLMRAFSLPPVDVECFLDHVEDYARSLVDDQLSHRTRLVRVSNPHPAERTAAAR